MRIEKKVALAGPYGALANATGFLPEVADLPIQPKVLARAAEPAVEWALNPAPIGAAPPPLQRPQVASAAPQPVPPAVVASNENPPEPESRAARSQARNGAFGLPGVDSRTAVYDISARAVYLPSGRKLEAHSGLGDKMDNPRYVAVKNRGPTPPNVYDLTLRERPFHGVQAIRLKPVDEGKMFGRDGMLAHSYMLGPNGQSNGCVSFNDYRVFLQAFLRGEVDRLVVVARLPNSPSPALMSRRQSSDRYAANSY